MTVKNTTYEGRNKARKRQQQISMNQRSPTVTLAPARNICPRGAIQRIFLRESTKSDRNVGITNRYGSKGSNPEDDTTKTPRNPEDEKNVATSSPQEKIVSYPQGYSYISTRRRLY